MKKIYLFILLLSLQNLNIINGQGIQNPPQKFRVVAVQSADNSVQSVSNEISLYFPLALQVPNAFTPNGDGLNDAFGAVGEGVEDYRLVIFNRWGNIIFEANKLTKKWDGRYQGKLVPLGAYNYEIFARGKETGEFHKSGTVIVAK